VSVIELDSDALSLKQALRKLLARWRSKEFDADYPFYERPTEEICADELEAILNDPTIGMSRCANPDCPKKYFKKLRRTQQFCLDCKDFGQRAHKRKWWHAHKEEIRPHG
jgi:hypothetical protein